MRETLVSPDPVTTAIPLRQIAETRSAFPSIRLTFDVLIETQDVLTGLRHCAEAFDRSGLKLLALRWAEGGRISCRLAESGGSDLTALARAFDGSSARIETWTTTIGN